MAVASLAAILKPQILSLMQGSKEEKRGGGWGAGGGEGRGRSPNHQSGLLDMVTRCAAAMAQIKSWQYKLLQNEKAEKRIFFFSHSLSLFPLTSLSPSLPAHHLHWLSVLYKVQREDSFFYTQEPRLKKCKFSSSIHTRSCCGGVRIFSFFFTLNFSVCSPC